MNELEQLLKRLHSFGLLTEDEEIMYPKALLNIEMNMREKTDYIRFIENFNRITGKKYKADVESRELFYRDKGIYSLTDRINAVTNALKDEWVKQNIGILSPKWILKDEYTAKYVNYDPPKKQSKRIETSTNAPDRKAAV